MPESMYRSRVIEHGRAQIAHWCVEVRPVEQVAGRNGKSKCIFTITRARILVMWAMRCARAALHTLGDGFRRPGVRSETK